VVKTELHRRAPATRWYTRDQAVGLYRTAGFENIRLYHEFSREPAQENDTLVSILGIRP
jgi:hypothetical protein